MLHNRPRPKKSGNSRLASVFLKYYVPTGRLEYDLSFSAPSNLIDRLTSVVLSCIQEHVSNY